jgi:hypothetical protein
LLIEDTGRQYRYISYAQLESGLPQAKVLFLPHSRAMSPAEVASVTTFVESGGMVIADLLPAVTDEHGRAYDEPALADLFGVSRPDDARVHYRSFRLRSEAGHGLPALAGAVEGAESGLGVAAGAEALGRIETTEGQTPALVVKRTGDGRTVLLNFSLKDYARYFSLGVGGEISAVEVAQDETARLRLDLVEALMNQAGIVADARVIVAGRMLPGCDVVGFDAAATRYVGILPPRTDWREAKPEDTLQGEVRFPAEMHTYDARRQQYLGRIDRVAIDIEPATALLFARWAERPVGVDVEAFDGQATAGKPWQATFTVRYGEPETASRGDHVFHVSVMQPDGKERPEYGGPMHAPGGRLTLRVPLALDEPPGEWKIRVEEVATGLSTETRFGVSP